MPLLLQDFRLGVYTSATLPTMHASVGHIEQVLRAPGMFEVLMCRNQCVPAPQVSPALSPFPSCVATVSPPPHLPTYP